MSTKIRMAAKFADRAVFGAAVYQEMLATIRMLGFPEPPVGLSREKQVEWLYAKHPGPKKLWIFREPKGISPKRSRYCLLANYFGYRLFKKKKSPVLFFRDIVPQRGVPIVVEEDFRIPRVARQGAHNGAANQQQRLAQEIGAGRLANYQAYWDNARAAGAGLGQAAPEAQPVAPAPWQPMPEFDEPELDRADAEF